MTSATRYRLVGDHSTEHCGCAAVIDVLTAELERKGTIVGLDEEFDALVVNGEGSMHHSKRSFIEKMHAIRLAQDCGKRTYLLNSLWHENSGDFDDCLRRLDGLWVRGVASAHELARRHGLEAEIRIDLSHAAEVDDVAPVVDFGEAIVATDFYANGLGFVFLPASAQRQWSNVDLRNFSWSSLVRSLRTARLLIAGRHHGIYAACRAGIPFVPVRGNSHKIEDLLWTAGVDIPIAESISEAVHLARWALQNATAYQDLFDWMDEQPRWKLESSPPKTVEGQIVDPTPSVLNRAVAATHRRNFEAAARWWLQVYRERNGAVPYPRLAVMALVGAGEVETGLALLARTREGKPQSFVYTAMLNDFARLPLLWVGRRPGKGWWPRLREAAYLYDIERPRDASKAAAAAINEVASALGPVAASSARLMLACKLIQLNRHDQARMLMDAHDFAISKALANQEELLLTSLVRRADAHARRNLRRATSNPAWADPALRALVLRHRLLLEGATIKVVDELLEQAGAWPKHRQLVDLAISAAGEADRIEDALARIKLEPPEWSAKALGHLALAAALIRNGESDDPRLLERANLYHQFEDGRRRFEEMLAQPQLRIAVVGNSPCEFGRGKGSEIDEFDKVLRFNDYSVEEPFASDYGRRTDIDLQTYPIGTRSTHDATQPDHAPLLVQRHAFNIFDPRDWTPVLKLAAQGRELGYLSRSAFTEAALELGASPSAGFCIAHFMKGLRGHIDRSHFFGFSFTDQLGGSRKAHYFDQVRPSLLHDWHKEARAFDRLFE